MSQSTVIDTTATVVPEQAPPPAQPQQSMALQRSEAGAVSTKAMTVEELHDRLEFVRNVMRNEMKEDQDYGKIPGAGDKPSLLQPGAQKLLMVFGLTVAVKKEVLREFPNLPIAMHREYEFTLTIQAPNGKTWDGVGTCSTLEKKYRYRKGKRVCPHCRKDTIIQGKAEFGGGWLCWAKKGGCGAKFEEHDESITSQSIEDEENEDPAEQWNTVRKMAYKRALVHGAINATNTSELWTQDVEEMDLGGGGAPAKTKTAAKKQAAPARKQPPSGPPPQQQKPATDKAPIYPDEGTRKRLIEVLNKSELYATALEYFRKLVVPPSQATCLLPTETIENLPLQYVPVTSRQMWLLNKELESFANGHSCQPAYPPNALKPVPPPAKKEAPKKEAAPPAKQEQKPIEVPRDKNPDPNSPDAPWRSFPVPFGNHSGTQLAKLDKKVLFGFWANWRPQETWIDSQNVTRQTKPEKLARERIFRQMLDEAGKHYGFTNPDAEPGEEEPLPPDGRLEDEEDAEQRAMQEDDDVPF